MKKTLAILAFGTFLPLTLQAAPVEQWAKGVTETGGWVDFNKSHKDLKDNNLCWAAAASNIINWWQRQYEIPGHVPQGDAIWEKFKNSFTDEGGTPSKGFQWWLDGSYNTGGSSAYATLKDGAEAGYYLGYYGASDYVENFGGKYAEISDYIIKSLDAGYGLTLSLSYGHEVTLWGVEYDSEDSLITKMWLTDSDDLQAGYNGQGLIEIDCKGVKFSEDEVYLGFSADDYWYKGVSGDVFVLMGSTLKPADFLTPIPEPSMFGLLAGLGSLTLAGTRRFRRKGNR